MHPWPRFTVHLTFLGTHLPFLSSLFSRFLLHGCFVSLQSNAVHVPRGLLAFKRVSQHKGQKCGPELCGSSDTEGSISCRTIKYSCFWRQQNGGWSHSEFFHDSRGRKGLRFFKGLIPSHMRMPESPCSLLCQFPVVRQARVPLTWTSFNWGRDPLVTKDPGLASFLGSCVCVFFSKEICKRRVAVVVSRAILVSYVNTSPLSIVL